MAEAEGGDKVRVHYTGKLEDGTVFDTSTEGEPLEFTIGAGEVIPGFEQGVVGMETGEEKTIEVSSGDAYGPHRDDWVLEVDRDELPDDLELEIGQQLQIEQESGETTLVRVAAVTPDMVRLDANHPLAGEDLVFDVELVEIA
ncbi:MAG: FKBP-type peptidyl-prolyl cis-trans isomerase [Planctomycetota bacterium]